MEMKKIKIDDPKRGKRMVGYLGKTKNGKVLFKKNVKRKKHYMKVVKGYGIQKTVYDNYLRGKNGVIHINELDTGKYLVASIDTWQKHSRSGNYGDGKQIFLSDKYMHNADNFDRDTVEELPVQHDLSAPKDVMGRLKEQARKQGWYKKTKLIGSQGQS